MFGSRLGKKEVAYNVMLHVTYPGATNAYSKNGRQTDRHVKTQMK